MSTAPPLDRPRGRLQPRLLDRSDTAHRDHLEALGPLPLDGTLIDELARSGLTGRGGAAFPVIRKVAAMGPRGVVVGNGSEGEPGSAKDRLLLTTRPHLVIDGLLALGHAVGARRLDLVVTPSAESAVRAAVAERPDAADVRVTAGEHRFVGGEASAVVDRLTTGRGLPTDRAVRLTVRGVDRRPTLVQNVETLAHVGLIARRGGDWFRAVGHPDDPGTRLFSISGDVEHRGVLEAAGGSTLRAVLAGSAPRRVAGVLVGGHHGTWVGPEALDRPLGVPGLPGSIPSGAGVLIVADGSRCPLSLVAEIAASLAAESAGQCGPCVNGLPALAGLVERLARGEDTVPDIDRMIGLVDGRGACHHPDGTSRMVRSGLTAFAGEVAAHRRGRCGAVA